MKTKERFIMMLMLKHNVVEGKLISRDGDVKSHEFKWRVSSIGSHTIFEYEYYTDDFLQIRGAEKREPIAFFSERDTKLHKKLCRYVHEKKGMCEPMTQEIKDEIERLVVKKLLKLGKIKDES